MKFAFVTCVQLGLECMEEIYRCGGKLDLVITLKDQLAVNKSGRIWVDDFCSEQNLDVLKITNVNDSEVIREIINRDIDYLFIIGWSQIAKLPLLNAPRKGVLGMHPTLLPEGRGRAAIPWAILKGLKDTGVTMFILDEGVDTGPILAQEKVPIQSGETATMLYEKIAKAHTSLIRRVWPQLVNNQISPIQQDNTKATEWPGRRPADGAITPDMSVGYVDRLVRALTCPYPGAFFYEDDNTMIRVWAGKIANKDTAPDGSIKRVYLIDGAYDAVVYDIEKLTKLEE